MWERSHLAALSSQARFLRPEKPLCLNSNPIVSQDTARFPQSHWSLQSTQASSAHSFIPLLFTEHRLCASPVLTRGTQWEQE